jgi:SAM-dependent methyltransferase
MTVNDSRPSAASRLATLATCPRVLDAGGWFIPRPEATHVVDLLPYETRQGRLTLAPQPGERFTAATWTQVDFTTPGLHLPYADGFFDFAHCGHTIEDLSNPEPLLRELSRVARAGVIRCPSRLSEQTRGVRDRMSASAGHPHHEWIVDQVKDGLRLCSKTDSLPGAANLLPLSLYERTCASDPTAHETVHFWHDALHFTLIRGEAAAAIARSFARSRVLQPGEAMLDGLIRGLRRIKYWRRRESPDSITGWWRDVLALSRPYSRIPLPE